MRIVHRGLSEQWAERTAGFIHEKAGVTETQFPSDAVRGADDIGR